MVETHLNFEGRGLTFQHQSESWGIRPHTNKKASVFVGIVPHNFYRKLKTTTKT